MRRGFLPKFQQSATRVERALRSSSAHIDIHRAPARKMSTRKSAQLAAQQHARERALNFLYFHFHIYKSKNFFTLELLNFKQRAAAHCGCVLPPLFLTPHCVSSCVMVLNRPCAYFCNSAAFCSCSSTPTPTPMPFRFFSRVFSFFVLSFYYSLLLFGTRPTANGCRSALDPRFLSLPRLLFFISCSEMVVVSVHTFAVSSASFLHVLHPSHAPAASTSALAPHFTPIACL